jgi:hypothetical protein
MANVTLAQTAVDSLKTDSVRPLIQVKLIEGLNYLDSLKKDNNLRKMFFLNEQVSGEAVQMNGSEKTRDLPRLKSIRYRLPRRENWKFWTLVGSMLFISFIRISNIKRFDEQLMTASDFSIDLKFSTERTGSYLFNHLALFANFLISLSLFWVTYIEHHSLEENVQYSLRLWQQVGILLILYSGKFIISIVVGYIFEMGMYARVFLYNTLVVNNFLGVLLVFFNLFYIYIHTPETLLIVESIILILIFIAIIFRTIKNALMSLQAGNEQLIYIILYLCSFEIVPWLILLKLFINGR